jgi:hypothetical protein
MESLRKAVIGADMEGIGQRVGAHILVEVDRWVDHKEQREGIVGREAVRRARCTVVAHSPLLAGADMLPVRGRTHIVQHLHSVPDCLPPSA